MSRETILIENQVAMLEQENIKFKTKMKNVVESVNDFNQCMAWSHNPSVECDIKFEHMIELIGSGT
jgi:hypothetical protein